MVSKKNVQQNGSRPMRQTRQGGAAEAAAPYKKPGNNFNQQIMFNTSQIPDKGYLDFNNPTPPIAGPPASAAANGSPQVSAQQKKKNNKNKQKNKQPQQQQQQQLQPNGGNWNNKNRNPPPHQRGPGPNARFNGGMPLQRGFNPMHMGNGPIRGRRMMPLGPRGGPMPPHGFQAPMIPPIPPMGRGPPMGMHPPPFLRRSGRGGPMPPPMMPPHMLRGGILPPVPFNGAGGKIKKPNNKLNKNKVVKGKSSIKTLKTLVNQYPVDKPWVSAEILAEHDKKVDLENRLKGNKDDDLFAQFKAQRDTFVAMYEAARDEYLKQEAAAVKAKDAKDKQTINKTAAKDGNDKEAIANNNAKA